MAHRVAPLAEADLDEIWLYVAKESGSVEMANRLIDTVTDRFLVLAGFPHMGRPRDEDFGPGCPADQFLLFDNSDDLGYQLLGIFGRGLHQWFHPLPVWAAEFQKRFSQATNG